MKKKNKIYISAITLAIIGLVIIGYIVGLRIDGFKITKAGQISLTVPHQNSIVYLNGEEYKKTEIDNEDLTIKRLSNKKHTIAIEAPERWPWIKSVTVPYNSNIELKPFNILKQPALELIQKGTDDYNRIIREINTANLPTSESPLISDSGNISLHLEDNAIILSWHKDIKDVLDVFCEGNKCRREIEFMNIVKEIENIHFYPNKDDRIIISTDGRVSVLEIAEQDNRNFQHILLSQNPKTHLQNNSLYILDGEALGKVNLE